MSAPLSWNRYPRASPSRVIDLVSRFDALPPPHRRESLLPYGAGRSYGDVCLNPDGALLRTRGLARLIAFDAREGLLCCEAGATLGEILAFIVPRGWFLAVTPGTRFVTVGGAIANDVHGKNHHDAGAFGRHVTELELLRSDGERILCGPDLRPEWFAATVGGLGLTGLVTRATLKLAPIANPFLLVEGRRFASLRAFWDMNARAERDWPYTAAWIDCLAPGGRGLLLSARHAPAQARLPARAEQRLRFPLAPPFSLINALSLRAFNALYYRQPLGRGARLTPYGRYLHTLDGIENWNRIYGRPGFFQYQCVLPPPTAQAGVADLMKIVAREATGSFLAVLKTFGVLPSVGLLSFPRPGATLALDFPNLGERTFRLLAELDAVTLACGGAVYPAKDARMSGAMFRAGFPLLQQFSAFVDPNFSSGFWRRVMER